MLHSSEDGYIRFLSLNAANVTGRRCKARCIVLEPRQGNVDSSPTDTRTDDPTVAVPVCRAPASLNAHLFIVEEKLVRLDLVFAPGELKRTQLDLSQGKIQFIVRPALPPALSANSTGSGDSEGGRKAGRGRCVCERMGTLLLKKISVIKTRSKQAWKQTFEKTRKWNRVENWA